ncbi:hypothetical protein XH98_10815 [Bradyrhizobium sp. CCBAU 51745]|uniref:hypothetical protein n=1 Tax=Bradyrhizobium sp. CCBAU 51745 TaxID=1325099 RepID=UPI002304F053|nr:hypothetical protein [Bradyrhizobium sp. CCBAU 51745]MDA9439609.1 hypothetical protein [Bradyrhizobium sp. CCBAU 51745]
MKRILIGLIVAAVLVAGGWFGFNLYVQHRVTTEIEAAFEQIRSGGGKASHGRIGFDLPSRTLTIEDINVEPGRSPIAGFKAARIKAAGVGQTDDAHVSAGTIEIAGVELAISGEAGAAGLKGSYKIPQATLTNYSGPTRVQGAPASESVLDAYRFTLEQFADVTAASVTVPSLSVAMNTGTGVTGDVDITYSGLVIRNINRGKIDTAKLDHAVFAITTRQPSRPDKLSGELSDMIIDGFDANAVIAALDPAKANDETYRRVYRQVTTGSYALTSTQGVRAQVGRIIVEDIGYQPSKFRPGELLALLPKDSSAPPTPAQSRELMEKIAGVYEGLRVGKAEISNLSATTPQGTAKLDAIKYAEGEFAVEGLDAPAAAGQFKMDRFALKSFSLPSLLRWTASIATPGRAPSPDQMLGLFGVLAGAELKGVVAPFKNTKKLVTVDTVSLDWGQLIGSIPSKAHVVAKFVTPTDASDPKQLPLLAAGIDKLAIDLELGAAWTQQSNSLVLAPATLDIGGIARAQARLALANVSRDMFSLDPSQVTGQAMQIETGTIELSLHDSGVVDLVVAQFARMQNVSRDAARSAIVEMIRAQGEKVAASNIDAKPAVDAIASFVETSGQTLTIKLTPLGKVPVLQLMDVLNNEPIVALAQFRMEASTGL